MLRAFRSAVPRTQLLKSRLTIPKTSVIGRRYLATDSFLLGDKILQVSTLHGMPTSRTLKMITSHHPRLSKPHQLLSQLFQEVLLDFIRVKAQSPKTLLPI